MIIMVKIKEIMKIYLQSYTSINVMILAIKQLKLELNKLVDFRFGYPMAP